MRLNPAYCAAKELQKKSKFFNTVQFLKNQSGDQYCLIPLSKENTTLMFAGKSYRIEQDPHIAIYEYYKQSETQGLSVTHYTWYGVDEFDTSNHVVLHAYFDRSGKYIYSQIKHSESKEIIRNISQAEYKLIQKQAHTASTEVLEVLLRHISERHIQLDKAVNQYLNQLDDLSQHLTTQLPKYQHIANLCLESMEKKNLWTFGATDSRVELLKNIVSATQNKCKSEKKKNKKNFGFHSPAITPLPEDANCLDQASTEENSKKQISKIDKKSSNVLTKLTKIDSEITLNKKASDIKPWEKTLIHLELLNQKFRVLLEDTSTSFNENELIKTLQQINSQHKSIKLLFEENALNGNLEAIKMLRPFVTSIDIIFLDKLLNSGNVALCQFVIQNYDECLYYLNYCALSCSTGDPLEMSATLLQRVCLFHQSPEMLDMLLQHGANPDFTGINPKYNLNLLHMSIIHEKVDFVRVLLENGANPHPKNEIVEGNTIVPELKENMDNSSLKKALVKGKKTKHEFSISNSSMPLLDAIHSRNKKIITLLLQFGASVNQKNTMNFDALGAECCHQARSPDLDIIKLLLDFGANINAIQGNSPNATTPLMFACQKGDLDAVKNYIALGADPNLQLPNLCQSMALSKPVLFYETITALGKAAVKGHIAIVAYLLEQEQEPITFLTAAISFTLVIKRYQINIDPQTLEYSINIPSELALYLQTIICERYDLNTVHGEIEAAFQHAQQFFTAKHYQQALTSFYVCLLFGNPNTRHSVLYNLASCYRLNGNTEKAIAMYQVCQKHAPGSSISNLAGKQLEKLEPSSPLMRIGS